MIRSGEMREVSANAAGTVPVRGIVQAAQKRARADHFVGREAELADFAELLASRRAPRVIFVHGPGGIGKSSLLDGFEGVAEQSGSAFVRLDARQLAPSPSLINQAVETALSRLDPQPERPRILAVDHVEQLFALGGWLRERLLPGLPADLFLILAGRNGPSAEWRADPGLNALLTEYSLEPLDAGAVDDYLRRRGVAGAQCDAVQAFARGYPLPLALAADQVLREPDMPFRVDQFPDLIRSLVQWMLRDIDHPEDLLALQACATVRRLDEPLLASMLEREDASGPYDWLGDQHYTERQSDGLVIHDLVREIVIRDLRARNLKRHHTLIRRAIRYQMAGADMMQEYFRVKTVPEVIYTLRQEPHLQAHLSFLGEVQCYPDAVRPGEVDELAAEVGRLEGQESRAWFESWARRPGTEIMLLRDTTQCAVAFAQFLMLDARDMMQEQQDPCVRALFRHLRQHAPLRAGEQVLLVRYRMAHGTHQQRTPAWAELAAHLNGRMFTPGISVLALVADMRYPWLGMEENAEYRLLPDSEYHVGDHHFMISAHDLRREPIQQWANNTIERVLRGGDAPELRSAPVVLLERAPFEDAVRLALNHYHDDKVLQRSPLMLSPMLRRFTAQRDVGALRELIAHAGSQQPHGMNRVLELSYFQPTALKQLAVASELCMSERTLRRRLRDAQDALIETLWQRDTNP